MRQLAILLLVLNFYTILLSQAEYKEFLTKQFDTRYSIKGNFDDSIFQNDFSKLWTVKKLDINPDFFNPIRPEPLGFIGKDYQRLFIHFTDVRKNTDKEYYVRGKSKVKDNICDFDGIIKVSQVIEFSIPYDEWADYVIDPRTIKQGVLVGEYKFFEDSTQRNVGLFEGHFISNFLITSNGDVEYNVTNIFSDNYSNNLFIGTWNSYSSDIIKSANWGDYRIPESGDLDIGAGGFSPSDKYLKFGWQTYRDAYFHSIKPNEKAIEQEKNEWWIINK